MKTPPELDTFFRELPSLPPEDNELVKDYERLGRSLDDLPYTLEFDELIKRANNRQDNRKPREIFQRLLNLRKAARLPTLGRGSRTPLPLSENEADILRANVEGIFGGTMGMRDRLPYTDEFDSLVLAFNQQTGKTYTPHEIWRFIARIAK